MGTRRVTLIILSLSSSLAGCAAITNTNKVAVDYNRVFAKSRDEVLVTNILRASAREPLQFSTMGTVTGTVRNSGDIKLALPSLIGAGATILSPEFSVNEGINPSVSIIPLSDKEFTEGVLKSVSLETMGFFVSEGWDPEFLLTVLVGGVVCPDGVIVPNRGVYPDEKDAKIHYDDFVEMFEAVGQRPFIIEGKAQPFTTIRMPEKDAAAVLKDGVGEGRSIDGVKRIGGGNVEITIVKDGARKLTNISTDNICKDHKRGLELPAVLSNPALLSIQNEDAKILPRSVEAIIYFLGETHRRRWAGGACAQTTPINRWPYYRRVRPYVKEPEKITIFNLEKACPGVVTSTDTFMHTRFNGEDYYIRRAVDVPPRVPPLYCTENERPEHCDRTLSTLSFLNELIALQTSGSTITSSTPVIAIQSK